MYSSGILRNTSSSPCPNAPQNKARPARTARREKASYDGIDDASASATLSGSAGFLPSTTILRKMPADTLLPATTSTGRSAQADRFPCKRQSRTVFQHRSGTLDIPLRGLGRLRKIQCRTAIPHFREPQSGAANFKRHYACGVSSPPLLRLRLRFRLRRRPPVPAAAITLATTFSVAGLHIRSRDDTFCRYRTGTLRTVASTAPTTSPAASVSATARPTASPAAAMTGKKRRGYIQGLHLRLPARTISESPAR